MENAFRSWICRAANGNGLLCSDDFDPWGVAELVEEVFAVFPRQAECANVGDPDSGNYCGQGCCVIFLKVAVEQCAFCPVDEDFERNLVVEIRGDLFGGDLFRDGHGIILHLAVARIHRVFLVDLNQAPLVIIDFLPEFECAFCRVDLFQVACEPARPTGDIERIEPPPGRDCQWENFASFCSRVPILVVSLYGQLSSAQHFEHSLLHICLRRCTFRLTTETQRVVRKEEFIHRFHR